MCFFGGSEEVLGVGSREWGEKGCMCEGEIIVWWSLMCKGPVESVCVAWVV